MLDELSQANYSQANYSNALDSIDEGKDRLDALLSHSSHSNALMLLIMVVLH